MNEQEYQQWREQQNYFNSPEYQAISENQKEVKQAEARQEHLKQVYESEQKLTHSRPVVRQPKMPDEVQRTLKSEETLDVLVVGDTNAPPSIYKDLNNKTFLTNILKLRGDTPETEIIDNFIQTKMRVGKLVDNAQNYERVFNNLLAKLNLSTRQQKPYILQKLGLHLSNLKNDYEDDDIDDVIVTLMSMGKVRGQHEMGGRSRGRNLTSHETYKKRKY